MKSVLISIKPKYCELITSGKKTVEVRKTKPKIETPFKCYIYCTIDGGVKGDMLVRSKLICGKVIGEFVCDRIIHSFLNNNDGWFVERGCLTQKEIDEYQGDKAILYGWHISDLVIYDKPRELSDFKTPKWFRDCENGCDDMERMRCPTKDSRKVDKMCGWCRRGGNPLTRPPQSWCYVESEGTE